MFEGVLRFWLDRGVDGFRVDVAHGLFKEASLRDQVVEPGGSPVSGAGEMVERNVTDRKALTRISHDVSAILNTPGL